MDPNGLEVRGDNEGAILHGQVADLESRFGTFCEWVFKELRG